MEPLSNRLCASPTPQAAASTVLENSRLSPAADAILAREGVYGLGEAYVRGEWQHTHLDAFMHELFSSPPQNLCRSRVRLLWYHLRERVSNMQRGRRAFEVARRHYDLGNDLFAAMLDETMSYTSGCWRGVDDLNSAQENKLRLLCDKLGLERGMRVLDIGCGWGNFARYAAEQYGAVVVGVTVSEQQVMLARQRCRGLPVEIRLADYATLNERFDAVASIEMIEAVGRKNLHKLFATVQRCLHPGGWFALQAISADTFSRTSPPAIDQFVLWLLHRIFPNGYVPKLGELMLPVQHGFVVEHLENFAEDYDLTLQAWLRNFERGWPQLRDRHGDGRYGDQFARMWRFYLCGCMAAFRTGRAQLYQILYQRR